MNNELTLQISEQRDTICNWMVERFREHLNEKRMEDAMAIGDEFFEWADPENYINESTLFYNEDALKQLYIHTYESQISELVLKICKEQDADKRKVLESHLETIRKLCPQCNETKGNN